MVAENDPMDRVLKHNSLDLRSAVNGDVAENDPMDRVLKLK